MKINFNMKKIIKKDKPELYISKIKKNIKKNSLRLTSQLNNWVN